MIQRGKHLRLALEPRKTIDVVRKSRRKDFDGDVAPKLRIAGAIDLTHAACAQRADDLIRTEVRPGG